MTGNDKKQSDDGTPETTPIDPPEASGSRPDPDSTVDDTGPPFRVSELVGEGSGMSLDGRSLILPDPNDDIPDDVSSINTALYTDYRGEMRILGPANIEEDSYGYGFGSSPSNDLYPPTSSPQMKNSYHRPEGPLSHGGGGRSMKSKDTEKYYEDDDGCIPLWISQAPRWLKLVIVFSTALLIGAIVLIGVGAALAIQNNKAYAGSSVTDGGGSTPFVPISPTSSGNNVPTQAPGPASPSGPSPSSTPADTPPVVSEGPAPTLAPTGLGTPPPTTEKISFFVIGGRFTGASQNALPQQLESLPNLDGESIMFHLGDWNSPFATQCVEASYVSNVEMYQNSPVPVYFVPGDNEFNDCPDPVEAFGFWHETLVDFEKKHWPQTTSWNVARQEPDHAENFAFLRDGVLFVGINLVGGKVHDTDEWTARHVANLEWIDTQVKKFDGNFTILSVLAHADPDVNVNDSFFSTFFDRVENDYADFQILFIHRNLGVESWGVEPAYKGMQNLMMIVVEGSIWPPMLIEIDLTAGVVDVDQDAWYDDYSG